MGKSKQRSGARRIIAIVCAVVLAAALVVLLFFIFQYVTADRIYSEAAEQYLISATDEIRSGDEPDRSISDKGTGSDNGTGTSDTGTGQAGSAGSLTIDWDGLWAVNPDVCAWIQIPAIPTINYPVIHYTDNDYYLRRSWQGTYLVAGCIMEDYHCSPDFTDFHTILYGHNMTSSSMAGTMFGQLKKFQNPSFYEASDDRVIIYTPERTLYYTIFSVHVVDPNDPGVYLVGAFTRDQAFDFVENLRNASDYDTGVWADGDDQILTLSTCSGVTSSKRLVVHSKLTTEVSMTAADDTENAGDHAEGVEDE